MNPILFRRAWRVTVGLPGLASNEVAPLVASAAGSPLAQVAGVAASSMRVLDVSAADIEFKILRSLKSVPNKCDLTIWNLTSDHRAQLLKRNSPTGDPKKLVGVPVQIEAGYVGQTSLLFAGDLRQVASQGTGTDFKTALSGDDGGTAFREARINRTFRKGTFIGNILAACCEALGIGIGNARDFVDPSIGIAGIGKQIPASMTLSGAASKELNKLARSIGLTWSIQNGALQLLPKGQPLNSSAIHLSPATGLIGSPEASIDSTIRLPIPKVEVSVDGQKGQASARVNTQKPHRKQDAPGMVKAKSLIIPGLVPGRQVLLDSSELKGHYMISEVEYTGQTFAQPWYADMVLRDFS